jgi:hypothetical protein
MATIRATRPPEYVLLDAAEFALHAIDNVLNERHPDNINTLKSAHIKLKAGIAGMKSGVA